MRKPLPKKLRDGLGAPRRRAVNISQEDLVKTRPLFEGGSLPLLVEPAGHDAVDLHEWTRTNRERVEGWLDEHGGILFRGFGVASVEAFEEFIVAASGEPLEYKERSSPRSSVGGRIYTSTDYPPEQSIFLHNENSYQSAFPVKIFFYCVQPAAERGETPIADCRRVLGRIDASVRDRFLREGWRYVRNFGDGFGLPWQTVFQTDDREVVEEHCRQSGIEVEWKPGNRLRLSAVRPAAVHHPRTGAPTWFNHATIFHVSTLAPEVRQGLLETFDEEDLPTNSYYGDGTSIEPEVMEHLREAYLSEKVQFPWQKGDVLMLDNLLAAHGREPFSGERKVVVGMAEPKGWQDVRRLGAGD